MGSLIHLSIGALLIILPSPSSMRLEHVDLDPDDVRLSQVLCCTTSHYVPSHPQLDRHPHCKQMRHRRACAEGKEGVTSCGSLGPDQAGFTYREFPLYAVSPHSFLYDDPRPSLLSPRALSHCIMERSATYVSFAHIDYDGTTIVASGAHRTKPRVLRPQASGPGRHIVRTA